MKYTPGQIRQMAREFINAYQNPADQRWITVLQRLNQKGWPAEHSLANIKHLAK